MKIMCKDTIRTRSTHWRNGSENYLFLILMVCIALAAVSLFEVQPRLIWNVSASVPRGLYWLRFEASFQRGDLVLAQLPIHVRLLADERDYLPASQPALKIIAALPGDTICSENGVIWIQGKSVARTQIRDRHGRILPSWKGCVGLKPDQIFLLNAASAASFDGRYFGPSERRDIIGVLSPIWVF